MSDLGLIHVYYGDGKGRTTAAMGVALRAAGSGYRVLISQFFKDGSSSELKLLTTSDKVTVKTESRNFGMYDCLSETEKVEARQVYTKLLSEIISMAVNYDLLILDEVLFMYRFELIDREILMNFLKNKPKQLEVIMTGREAAEEILSLADYVTYMKKIKHPFDRKIFGRMGIEY